MEKFVHKHLVWIYIAALVALACLAISSYFVARNALESQIDNTYLVNVTAHQRTLSQRIVLLGERAMLLPSGEKHTQALEDLELTVEKMTTASRDLSGHISSLKRSDPLAEEIYTHYYRGANPLSGELTDFLFTARIFLATSAGAKRRKNDLQHMYEGSENLLLSLGTLVDLFEKEHRQEIQQAEAIEEAILGAMLLALTLEAFFVFRPTVRQLGSQMRSLKDAKEESQLLASVVESSKDIALVFDTSFKLEWANEAFTNTTGFTLEESIGLDASILLNRSDGSSGVIEQWAHVVTAGKPFTAQAETITKSGDALILDITSHALRNDAGKIHKFVAIARDISQQTLLHESIARMQNILNEVGHVAQVGGWTFDVSSDELIWTPGLFEILEMDPDGAQPSIEQAFSFIDDGAREEIEALWQTSIDAGSEWSVEAPITTTSGQKLWVHFVGRVQLDDEGVVQSVFGVIQNITSRKLQEQALISSKEHAQEVAKEAEQARNSAIASDQAKSEFLANMSHEIRTPMNGVLGTLNLLEGSSLERDQRNLVRVCRDSAEMLLTILNDILDFSKLESGQMHMELVSFNLDQLLDGVTSLFSDRAAEKGIFLTTEISPTLPQWVEGDPTRLRQILFNLISNAIKFTEKGGVAVTVHVSETDISSNTAGAFSLTISVQDSGIGISDEAKESLFGRFNQADATITRRFGGSGLGLAISKQLIGLMDGEIGVDSVIGQGSRFWFRIPSRGTDAPAAEAVDETQLNPALASQLSVLVAEDNKTNQLLIRRMLSELVGTVTIVNNGLEAVEAAQETLFDLIFMDVQMPVLDGVSATREIKALAAPHGHTPIYALSANVFPEQIRQYLASGMEGHVAKPIERGALETVLATIQLNAAQQNAGALAPLETEPSLAQIEPTPSKGPIAMNYKLDELIDMERLTSLQESLGSEASAELIDCLSNDMVEILQALKQAISQGDESEAKMAAHQIRGAAANGAVQLVASAALDFEKEEASIETMREALPAFEGLVTESVAVYRTFAVNA
ncbi:MAG: response regulator [Parvibaculaceae bacterium]|nr:response regulator [Parvibaculaceae bacterium]